MSVFHHNTAVRCRSVGKVMGIILLTLVNLILGTGRASAETAVPHAYIKTTPNGRYRFIMLPPGRHGSKDKLSTLYSASGLYQSGASGTPLWTVPWYEPDVDISSDGQSLVRWHRHNCLTWTGQRAISFYRDGKLTATYDVENLVRNTWRLETFVCTGEWLWLQQKTFDDLRGRVSILTETGERYVFDITNGRALQGQPLIGRSGIKMFHPMTLVLVVVIFCSLAWTSRLTRNWRRFDGQTASRSRERSNRG